MHWVLGTSFENPEVKCIKVIIQLNTGGEFSEMKHKLISRKSLEISENEE